VVRGPVPGSVGERLREVRGPRRLEDFVPELNAASRALGEEGPIFSQSRVSKLELGAQRASLDDIAIYALLDPKRRGKLWLAWNEAEDSAMARPHGPSVIKPAPDEIFDRAPLPRRKPAAKKQA
jgi:hypothetical protein